jgi:hypothetical protein
MLGCRRPAWAWGEEYSCCPHATGLAGHDDRLAATAKPLKIMHLSHSPMPWPANLQAAIFRVILIRVDSVRYLHLKLRLFDDRIRAAGAAHPPLVQRLPGNGRSCCHRYGGGTGIGLATEERGRIHLGACLRWQSIHAI